MIRHFVFICIFGITAQSQAQNILQNMQSAAAIDITAPISFGKSANNKLEVRSAEVVFFGPLDPTFDASLNIAAHEEEGEFKAELHEGYLSSSKLIPSSRFRLGKFFLGLGRLNQFHSHDWPFISAPKVHSTFFDSEGVADSGGEFSILLPTNVYWDITVGMTNGYKYGHTHDDGEKPQVPTHYVHAVNFVDFEETGGLQWGLNYLGRTDAEAVQTKLYGLDFVFKKSSGKTLDFLIQSELWFREKMIPDTEATQEAGAYFFPQKALSERLYAGIRFDLFSELSRRFQSDGSRQDNADYSVVPTLTYKNSEFTLFRFAYTHNVETFRGEADATNQQIEFQVVTILGAHPAHSF